MGATPGTDATDDRIQWLDPHVECNHGCVLCANGSNNRVFMRAKHSSSSTDWLDVARCAECNSAWFPSISDAVIQYPTADEIEPDRMAPYIRHYFELVAGIDWKISLAERLPHEDIATMLEVGCNAGGFLDYGRVVWGADVVGLEPSAYGIAGAAALDLPILHSYMAETPALRGRTFDFVCAIEVLEHVDDPSAFLAEIREFMAPGGVAMITTPGTHALLRTTPRGELLAALSPGAHRFVASQQRLQAMIDEVGFGWSHIEAFGMTQVAYLADRPIELVPFGAGPPVEERRRTYYERAVARSLGDERQRLGDRINLYTTKRSLGDPGTPADEHRIESELACEFDLDLDDLGPLLDHQATIGARAERGERIAPWGERMPYNLPAYLFWRGHRDDLSESRRTSLWESAALLAAHGLSCDPVNLFVYAEVLTPTVQALAGRPSGDRRAQLLTILNQIPEGSGLTIPAPTILARLRWILSAARQRVATHR